MRRVYIRVPDNIGDNVGIFMNAEEIKTWSKAIIKLVDLGLRYYCKKDSEVLDLKVSNLTKKVDAVEKSNQKIIVYINKFLESQEGFKNENN